MTKKEKERLAAQKKLVDKWGSFLGGINDPTMQANTATILESQARYLGPEPPDEPVWASEDDYTNAVSKNLLVGKLCENCKYKGCPLERQKKYGTCTVWDKEDDLNPLKIILPLIRRVYPNTIANEIISVQPMASPTLSTDKDLK